jgi:hypothetical protein
MPTLFTKMFIRLKLSMLARKSPEGGELAPFLYPNFGKGSMDTPVSADLTIRAAPDSSSRCSETRRRHRSEPRQFQPRTTFLLRGLSYMRERERAHAFNRGMAW